MDFSESTVYERINLTNDFRPGARSARRKPGLTKGDSTESSNPFFVSDDEKDTIDEKFEHTGCVSDTVTRVCHSIYWCAKSHQMHAPLRMLMHLVINDSEKQIKSYFLHFFNMVQAR